MAPALKSATILLTNPMSALPNIAAAHPFSCINAIGVTWPVLRQS